MGKKPRRKKKTLVGQLAPFNKPSKFDLTADVPVDLTSDGRPKRQRVAATVFDPSAPELNNKKTKRHRSLRVGKEENSMSPSGLYVEEEEPIKAPPSKSKRRFISTTAFEPTMPTIYEIEQKVDGGDGKKSSSIKVNEASSSLKGRKIKTYIESNKLCEDEDNDCDATEENAT